MYQISINDILAGNDTIQPKEVWHTKEHMRIYCGLCKEYLGLWITEDKLIAIRPCPNGHNVDFSRYEELKVQGAVNEIEYMDIKTRFNHE